jgi:salicylate hydroxylase
MKSKSLEISIVGAGIGGLVAALALKKRGHEPIIYEKAEYLSELGAGIQLSPNANKVLKHLGVMEELQADVYEPEAFQFVHYRTGKVLAQQALKNSSVKIYGSPNYDIHRADLQKALLKIINKQEIQIKKNSEILDIYEEANSAFIKTKERVIGSDVVIGADGIHSVVRKKLWGEDQARYTGNVAWRMLVPIEEISSKFLQQNTKVWLGPKKHFVQYLVKGGNFLNCVCLVEQNDWTNEDWSEKGDISELKHIFSDWHPEIQVILESTKPGSLFKWGLHDRAPMNKWSKGRFSLLGDAAHPMLPFVAQGAAMAIEDGIVLASSLSSFDNVELGLNDYENKRKYRTAKAQKTATRNATIFHLSDFFAIFRNLVMKFFIKKIMDSFYKYDAISK